MAVLSPPFLLGAAGQVMSGRLGRLALGASFLPGATGVLSVSGALIGPAGTQGELSLAGGNITVKPFRAVVQCSLDATAGQYLVVNDADAVFATTAQHATQFRKGLVVIDVDDSQVNGVASSATTDRARMYLLDGALAATSGAAALPALPDSSLALGEYLIPPTGQTITITPYNPRTTTRGGRLPVATEAAVLALSTSALWPGFEVYAEDTKATAVWNGTRWLFTDTVTRTYTPTMTANGVATVIGNGALTGRYRRIGELSWLRINLVVGSTSNLGNGAFLFALPVQAAGAAVSASEQVIHAKAFTAAGNALGYGLTVGQASIAVSMPASVAAGGATDMRPMQNAAVGQGGGTGVPVAAGQFTMQANHNMVIEGTYETV